jgi:CheY-like chemotaxis protein
LIVEDVPSLAETYAAYLATEPAETIVAHTGAAALEVSPSTLYHRTQAWQDAAHAGSNVPRREGAAAAAQQPTYL